MKSSSAVHVSVVISIGLITAILLSIWVWPTLQIPNVETNPHVLYLLSTIAQSLAAIVGLVFAASFIGSQIAQRQIAGRQAKAIDRFTAEFLLLFVAAILLSLWLLSNPNPAAVKLAFSFAASALIMLLPFFLVLKDKLNVETQIQSALEQARVALKKEDGEPAEVHELDNAAVRACMHKDYTCYDTAVNALSEVVVSAYENRRMEAVRAGIDRMSDIALLSLEDPRAPYRVISVLEKLGVKFADKGADAALIRVVRALQRISVDAADRNVERPVSSAIAALDTIGAKSSEKGILDVTAEVLAAAEAAAIKALTHDMDDPIECTMKCISRIASTPVSTAATADPQRGGRKMGKVKPGDIAVQLAEVADRIAIKAIETGNSAVAKKATMTLFEIAKNGADGAVNEETATLAIAGLNRIGIQSAEHDMSEIGRVSLDALGEVGLSYAKNNRSRLVRKVIDAAGDVGIRNLSEETLPVVANMLGNIGVAADEKGMIETVWASQILSKVGASACKSSNGSLREQFVSCLEKIVETAKEKNCTSFSKELNRAHAMISAAPSPATA